MEQGAPPKLPLFSAGSCSFLVNVTAQPPLLNFPSHLPPSTLPLRYLTCRDHRHNDCNNFRTPDSHFIRSCSLYLSHLVLPGLTYKASAPSLTAIISDSPERSVFKEALLQQNGEYHLADPADTANSVSLTNKTSLENPRLSNGSPREPASETEQEHINTGEKRDLETTSFEQTSAEAFNRAQY
ncbi:hypothetical protein BDW69DRAFT_139656 [Aspergillus filifer]